MTLHLYRITSGFCTGDLRLEGKFSSRSTELRPFVFSCSHIKLVASGLCRLLSGFPFFSEAIQVAYSNPERRLSRKRPPRCPSSKPSSMGGRSRKNDIIDHPASLTLPPGGFTAAIANSKPTPGRVGIQDFGPSAFDSPKCVSHVQPLPHAARCGEVRASFS
mgnify:CR=1 FL=1